MIVVPNATLKVLRELTGDGASKQSLRIERYVSTTDRTTPEVSDILIDTAASYEGLVKESLEILESIKVNRIIPSVVSNAFRNDVSSEALAREVFSKAFDVAPKSVVPKTAIPNLQSLVEVLTAIFDGTPETVVPLAVTSDLQSLVIEGLLGDLSKDKKAALDYLVQETEKARDELLVSFNNTLEKGVGNNEAYTHSAEKRGGAATYEYFGHGVKVHLETGDLHVQGMEVSRVVIEEGVYKPKRSKAKTLAKNELRRRLPLGKWRQLVLRRGKFQVITIRGQRFTLEDFAPAAD